MPSIKHLYAILRHHLRNCLNFSPKKSLMQNTSDASVNASLVLEERKARCRISQNDYFLERISFCASTEASWMALKTSLMKFSGRSYSFPFSTTFARTASHRLVCRMAMLLAFLYSPICRLIFILDPRA